MKSILTEYAKMVFGSKLVKIIKGQAAQNQDEANTDWFGLRKTTPVMKSTEGGAEDSGEEEHISSSVKTGPLGPPALTGP